MLFVVFVKVYAMRYTSSRHHEKTDDGEEANDTQEADEDRRSVRFCRYYRRV
jgi:hypothetical protein